MLGTQFHPEFKSRPTAAHPLFCAFLKAADALAAQRREATYRAVAQAEVAVTGS
jgi:CTP synthase